MSKKKIIAIVIIILIIILGVVASFYFWPKSGVENNQAKAGFTLNGPIDYEKYKKAGLTQDRVDILFNKMRDLDNKIQKTPDYIAMLSYAGFLKILKENDESLKAFERARDKFPDFGPAYAEIADLYIYPFGRYDEAVDLLKLAIEKAPYRSDYYRWLADLYVAKFPDKKTEIEPLMLSGAKETPENATAFYNYLISYFEREGDLKKAIDYAKKSLAVKKEAAIETVLKDLQGRVKK
ncbi:MAG: hypothetical protein WC610_03560 [Patescibacteria group bacterium]